MLTLFVPMACLNAASGGLLLAYDIGVTSMCTGGLTFPSACPVDQLDTYMLVGHEDDHNYHFDSPG
jgi:hypothetical protein